MAKISRKDAIHLLTRREPIVNGVAVLYVPTAKTMTNDQLATELEELFQVDGVNANLVINDVDAAATFSQVTECHQDNEAITVSGGGENVDDEDEDEDESDEDEDDEEEEKPAKPVKKAVEKKPTQGKPGNKHAAKKPVKTPTPADKKLVETKKTKKLDLPAAAAFVLKEDGGSMSIKKMVDLIEESELCDIEGKTPDKTLSGCITRDIEEKGEKSRFVRVGKGLYAARGSKGATAKAAEKEPADKKKPTAKKVSGGISLREAAIQLLKETKQPMQLKEIIVELAKRKIWNSPGATPDRTLSTIIIRDIRDKGKDSAFVHAHRGFFTVPGVKFSAPKAVVKEAPLKKAAAKKEDAEKPAAAKKKTPAKKTETKTAAAKKTSKKSTK